MDPPPPYPGPRTTPFPIAESGRGPYDTGNWPPPPPPSLPPRHQTEPGPWLALAPAPALRLQTSMPDLRSHGFDPSPTGGPSPHSSYSPSSFQRPVTPSGGIGPGPGFPATPTSAPVSAIAARPGPGPFTPVSDNKPFWQTALSEATHFAGGLLPQATESNKHYTILRHSPPLVFYRGPATSVEITIFSAPNYPLPSDRSLWLLQRGYSGDSGMKLKVRMGSSSTDWVEVTPAVKAQAEDAQSENERAWRRDIDRIVRRERKDRGEAKGHVARETHVVRIPAVASDGYFRLALCTGGSDGDEKKRKVLCWSPVFRVASTSTDSSVFRGASLSTMPLEVGVKVASVVANNTVQRYTGPVVGMVQGRIDKLKPGRVMKAAGGFVAGELRRDGTKADDASGRYFLSEPQALFYDENLNPVGPESGPEAPFPLKFSGKVVPGTGRGQMELGIPTANLDELSPGDVHQRLRGVYVGWASLPPPAANTSPVWHQAVITVSPSPYARAAVVVENIITVHLFHEFGASFTGAKLKVIAMAYLRPALDPAASLQERLDMVSRDVLLAVATLSRVHWGPEVAVQRLRGVKSARNLSDRYAEARDKVQRRVDSVPLHVLGVRTAGQEARDEMYGRGGYWIAR